MKGDICGGLCAWQGGIHGGGMHGRGVHGRGTCMAVGCVTGGMHGRRDGHCSGRYASYWNAFLFHAKERKKVGVSTIDLQLKAMKTQSYSIKNNDYSLRCSFCEFAVSNQCSQVSI